MFSVRELTIAQVCSIPCHLVSSKELGHFVAVTLLSLYHDLHLQLVNNSTLSSLTSGSFASKQISDALRVINRDCQHLRWGWCLKQEFALSRPSCLGCPH